MTFDEVLAQVLDLLQRQGRVSYRALKRRFGLDDEYLEDLKAEIIDAQRLAVDEEGKVLVWTRETSPAAVPASEPERAPLAYTPAYLAEKILTSRSALEGERKQVTVLFADLKGSTALIEGLDPEEARRLLDPALHIMMDAVHRYEGTVNQVLGDGIMALFGAPVAHEDHAVRACYAALALQAAMRHYAEAVRCAHGLEMLARVGLNSGEVVVRAIGDSPTPCHMRPLVAHCHLGLGTLYRQMGRGAETRAALSTAIALYRAMDMTFWIPQAEAVLAQVGGVA